MALCDFLSKTQKTLQAQAEEEFYPESEVFYQLPFFSSWVSAQLPNLRQSETQRAADNARLIVYLTVKHWLAEDVYDPEDAEYIACLKCWDYASSYYEDIWGETVELNPYDRNTCYEPRELKQQQQKRELDFVRGVKRQLRKKKIGPIKKEVLETWLKYATEKRPKWPYQRNVP